MQSLAGDILDFAGNRLRAIASEPIKAGAYEKMGTDVLRSSASCAAISVSIHSAIRRVNVFQRNMERLGKPQWTLGENRSLILIVTSI